MKKNRHQSLSMDRTIRNRAARCWTRGGFSLLELIVVLAVVTILTGLLLPAMSSLRENVNRVVCSSNQRQIGVALSMYIDDHYEMLPRSIHLEDGRWSPHELMSVHHGESADGWDGLGVLFLKGYCAAPQCFYCPSHRGEHPVERYLELWHNPGSEPIYANLHYGGHRFWDSGNFRTWRNVDRLMIASDGLRTASDFNHGNGMNALFGDASVRWNTAAASILPILPETIGEKTVLPDGYNAIWESIQSPAAGPYH